MTLKSDSRRTRLPCIAYPPLLPITEYREKIVTAIRKNPVVVITGETGSGKTTQVPKMCMEAGRGLSGLIGCTQPRRIAAITVARRIAEELKEEIGKSVGYKIRFDDRTPRDAFFKIMTDGILLMETQRDPLLRAYDTIIVDEAHERSLNIDFILGILKTILPRRRDLRIVITSATIDAEKFSRAFDDAPVIEVSGRLYPIEVRYQPLNPGLEENGEITFVDAAVRTVEDLVRHREQGDVLIFMPTEREIRETCELLKGRLLENAMILPLFSRLTMSEQQRAFTPQRARKIVVATNVAETSLTIPGIRYVIDTGLARIAQYNPRSRTAGLPVRSISRSSADQRKGRCGRVRNGVCIRLFSEEDYRNRPLYTPPEILRSNLAGVILRMLALHLGDIDSFPFIDPPAPKSIRDGFQILIELGAIETAPSYRLTEKGRLMAKLPLDPRISRMILEALKEGCLGEIVVIAAALGIQDPRERPTDKETQARQAHAAFRDPASDFSSLLVLWGRAFDHKTPHSQNHLRRFCRTHFLSWQRMKEWRDIHEQIITILIDQKMAAKSDAVSTRQGAELYTAIHRSILSGYLGHIGLKSEKNLYKTSQGREALIFPGSGLYNRGGTWIVAAEMIETSRLFARTVANIDSDWLEEIGALLCRRTYSAPHWEKERGEVVALEQVTLFGLTIVNGRKVSFSRIDPDEAAKIFIRSALVDGEVKRPLPFLAHNQELIKKITEMEEKIRRRDLLASEEEMAAFYEKRLPGICDMRTVQRLIRECGNDLFLRMSEEDLLVKLPDRDELVLYPESVDAGGWRLECRYHFDPGKPDDGITLKIPAHAVSSLPSAALDWAVPGLLRNKVMALLKRLPKEYRKQLQPLAQTVDLILKEMAQEGPLTNALGHFIYRKFGIDIPAESWSPDVLEEHLKLRFAVIDGNDKVIAEGRDTSIFRKEYDLEEESIAFSEKRRRWEKTEIHSWDFGDLPESLPVPDAGRPEQAAFPALVSSESGISIRLFRSSPEARQAHPLGVRALLALHLRDDLRFLHKSLAPSGDLKLWAAAFGGAKALENALCDKVIHDLMEVNIRTAAEFEIKVREIRTRLLTRGQEVLQKTGPLLNSLYDVSTLLRTFETANRGNRPILSFLENLRRELSELVPPDLLILYDADRIGHIKRYLRALGIRAERGAIHLEKVLLKGKEIDELAERHKHLASTLPAFASEEKRRAIEEVRWMIEEYKISLFAQEIKTAFPISRKRLDAKFDEIERLL
jgi:ATP-dependent helicase HrpA